MVLRCPSAPHQCHPSAPMHFQLVPKHMIAWPALLACMSRRGGEVHEAARPGRGARACAVHVTPHSWGASGRCQAVSQLRRDPVITAGSAAGGWRLTPRPRRYMHARTRAAAACRSCCGTFCSPIGLTRGTRSLFCTPAAPSMLPNSCPTCASPAPWPVRPPSRCAAILNTCMHVFLCWARAWGVVPLFGGVPQVPGR